MNGHGSSVRQFIRRTRSLTSNLCGRRPPSRIRCDARSWVYARAATSRRSVRLPSTHTLGAQNSDRSLSANCRWRMLMTTVATAVANQRQTDRSFYMALSFCVPICWTAVTMPLMRNVPGDPLLKRRACRHSVSSVPSRVDRHDAFTWSLRHRRAASRFNGPSEAHRIRMMPGDRNDQ